MVRTTALTDRTHGDRIRTLGAGKDVGHGGGEARAYAQAEGDDENFLKLFLRVFSLEEASFSIG
jgi:hypothetical protein